MSILHYVYIINYKVIITNYLIINYITLIITKKCENICMYV